MKCVLRVIFTIVDSYEITRYEFIVVFTRVLKNYILEVYMDNFIQIKKIDIEDTEIKGIKDIKGKFGVWFLIGKNINNKYECLQVAQSSDIGKEIELDINDMTSKNLTSLNIKNYVNQFGEKMFEYEEYDRWRARNLYYYLSCNFSDFIFICIVDKKLTDRGTRELLEKYIAYKTKSSFWVNGRPFIKEQSEEEKRKLIEIYSKILKDIRKKLEDIFLNSKLLDKVDDFISNNLENY